MSYPSRDGYSLFAREAGAAPAWVWDGLGKDVGLVWGEFGVWDAFGVGLDGFGVGLGWVW